MKKIIPIINLAAKFATINRTIGYRDGHLENDAEHSYQLALVCWSANEQYKLGLNNELILKYALVHDLVEVYAGDTDAHDDEQKIAQKKEREEKALEEFKADFKFDEITTTIDRYEKKQDVEAQLVYVLDKFIPNTNIYFGQANYYLSRKIDISTWRKWLNSKIDFDSLNIKLKPLVEESIKEIETSYRDTFYQG
jgi:5'-deoxynucleotidase YfbR-like HD superfamily hydrolase